MEMVMMNKTNDTSTLDHRPLADSELDAVTGGWLPTGIPGSGTPRCCGDCVEEWDGVFFQALEESRILGIAL
jgi:hypothetical protein